MCFNYFTDRNETAVLIIGLGQLTLQTAPFSERLNVADMYSSGLDAEEIMEAMMEQAYDRFTLSLKMIQVMVAKPGEKWREYVNDTRVTDMHILEPTDLYAEAEQCVFDDDPRLPKMKVSVKFPNISLSATDTKVLNAIDLALSIPLPVDDSLEPTPLGKDKASGLVTSSMSLKRFLDENQFRKKKREQSEIHDFTQFTDLEFAFVLHGKLLYLPPTFDIWN